jgi:hypothetical protein
VGPGAGLDDMDSTSGPSVIQLVGSRYWGMEIHFYGCRWCGRYLCNKEWNGIPYELFKEKTTPLFISGFITE